MSSKTFNYKQYSDRMYALSPEVIEKLIGSARLLLKPLEDYKYLSKRIVVSEEQINFRI